MFTEPVVQKPAGEHGAADLAELMRQRLLSGLYLGSLRLGARLPSLRQIASEYSVDVRSVRRAYQLLERDGLVELRARSGIYFAPAAERARSPLSPRSQWLINVALDGLNRAITLPELADRVAQHTHAAHIRVACIECNDDQTVALRGELERAFGLTAVDRDVDRLLRSSKLDADLADFDLLVTTPFHAGEVEELAARLGRPWLSMESRSNVFAEIARLLARGPVWYLVGDPKFATKLGKIFANIEYGDRLRVAVVGEDDVAAAPPNVPLYVTQLARERLGSALPPHARPSVCMFASGSSRELIAFIIAQNIARHGA